MTQQNNEFEKLYGQLPHDVDSILNYQEAQSHFYAGWQAAKADSEREIAELRAENQGQYEYLHKLQVRDNQNRIYINVLREALEEAAIFVDNHSEDWYKPGQFLLAKCKQALTSTPAQSLAEHDDEVIEMVVTLLKDSAWDDGIIDMRVDDLIEDVLTLKGNESPYSANLDIYNSVIFSDGSHGTMIMESKIVKWLCRNRSKDYFDDMVEGK